MITPNESRPRAFLRWIYERLKNVYHEDPSLNFMQRLDRLASGQESWLDLEGVFVIPFDIYAAAGKAFGLSREQARERILQAQFGGPLATPDLDELKRVLEVILGPEKLADLGINRNAATAAINEIHALRTNLFETTPDGMKTLRDELAMTRKRLLEAVRDRDIQRNRANQFELTSQAHKDEAARAHSLYNQLRTKVLAAQHHCKELIKIL